MNVFLTGANGFIGSTIVPELLRGGHRVLGLTRSDAGAKSLLAAGAEAHRGSLEDPRSLRQGASQSDAVIHCAYDNDLSNLEEVGRKEVRAIEALGAELAGTNRPLLLTSVTGLGAAAPGQIATEDHFDPHHRNPRIGTENAGGAVAERGVNVSVVRLPQVHSPLKMGFVSQLVRIAREKGVSAYIGDGGQRWPAVHVLDVARLYRLVLEAHVGGSRYHAVAEEGIPLRQIAEAIGRGLQVPVVALSLEEASPHFGWLAMFVGMDMPASSQKTQQRLGWRPTGPGLFADLGSLRPAEGAAPA